MKSPCRNCKYLGRDKNHDGCINCPERIVFVMRQDPSIGNPGNDMGAELRLLHQKLNLVISMLES